MADSDMNTEGQEQKTDRSYQADSDEEASV
jgi:hypothetical protein